MPIETLNLSANDGMVDISKKDKPSMPPPEPGFKEPPNSEYDNQRANMEKNNVDKEQMMELSTPLNEVMDMPAPGQPPAMQAPMPDMMMQQPQMMQQPAMDQSMMMPQQQPQQPVVTAANPGGLTDEQMDALLVAVAAAVAFSPQLKDKMMQFMPTLFNEAGARTLGGVAVTAIVAGGMFFGVKKFVLKR